MRNLSRLEAGLVGAREHQYRVLWPSGGAVVGFRVAIRNTDKFEICLLNPCNVVAQLVTSQPVTVDTTLTYFSFTDVLSSSRIM